MMLCMASSSPIATLVVAYFINVDGSTGDHVGYGTLVGPSGMVVLHPRTGDRVLPGATHQLTLRLQIADDADHVQVTDGTVHLSSGQRGVGLPPAIVPTSAITAQPSRAFWQGSDAAARLASALTEDEQNEPSEPPFHVPEAPGIGGMPGVHGPWCVVFPSCPGCH